MVLTLISLGQKLIRLGVVVVVITVIGQIPIRDKSIENHYHEFVNDEKFQSFYWALMTPVTWTTEKVVSLVKTKTNPEVR
jgi:hypothetical protein